MEFLDSKEQVLDIKLTQYGKYLLSRGELKPAFYMFFDNNILYDAAYAGLLNEGQNNIHDRIKSTPQLGALHVYRGVESNLNLIQGTYDNKDDRGTSKNYLDKHLASIVALGTISLESSNAPAWNVTALKGYISGSQYYQTGSQVVANIPKIQMRNVDFKTRPSKDLTAKASDINNIASFKFPDDSYIQIIQDSVIIDIQELNTPINRDSFEMEVFNVETILDPAGNTRELLRPLSFKNTKVSNIRNGLFVPDDANQINEDPAPNNVEYYLELVLDDNIEDEVRCVALAQNRAELIGLSSRDCVLNEASSLKQIDTKTLYEASTTEDELNKKC